MKDLQVSCCSLSERRIETAQVEYLSAIAMTVSNWVYDIEAQTSFRLLGVPESEPGTRSFHLGFSPSLHQMWQEKEEEVCSLRQSVLRSSQSQLRVKFANS